MASNTTKRLQDAEKAAFTQINTVRLNFLNARVKACPARRDMKEMLEHKDKTFLALWEALRDISVNLSTQTAASTDVNSEADERAEFKIPNNATLIRPLSKAVTQAVMNESDACEFDS